MQRQSNLNNRLEPQYSTEETLELLYRGRSLQEFSFDKVSSFDSSYEELFGKEFQEISRDLSWTTPEPYSKMDIKEYVLNLCTSQEATQRVNLELAMYEERGLLDLLRFMVYIVDYMRENNHVWGVGRGSSVASYVLFLIGIHKIDSLKYKLCITEFLR